MASKVSCAELSASPRQKLNGRRRRQQQQQQQQQQEQEEEFEETPNDSYSISLRSLLDVESSKGNPYQRFQRQYSHHNNHNNQHNNHNRHHNNHNHNHNNHRRRHQHCQHCQHHQDCNQNYNCSPRKSSDHINRNDYNNTVDDDEYDDDGGGGGSGGCGVYVDYNDRVIVNGTQDCSDGGDDDGDDDDDDDQWCSSKANEGHCRSSVMAIMQQLRKISAKLKEEKLVLAGKEKEITNREQMLSEAQRNFHTVMELEVKRKVAEVEKKANQELEKCLILLKDKTKETKRLRDNFDTLKAANESLRVEVDTLINERTKCERQSLSLQARLTNLQRLYEQTQKQVALPSVPADVRVVEPTISKNNKNLVEKPHKKVTKASKALHCLGDLLPSLLMWVVDMQLAAPLRNSMAHAVHHPHHHPTTPSSGPEAVIPRTPASVSERCLKVIPCIVEFLRDYPSYSGAVSLPCLQFVYWALKNIEDNPNQSKSGISSTLRRLGEELYHSRSTAPSRIPEEDTIPSRHQDTMAAPDSSPSPPHQQQQQHHHHSRKEGTFFKSPDCHVRLLSALIVLKTVSQVDFLANALDVLKSELQCDMSKRLFLYYHGTPVVLHFLKPVHKTLVNNAIDVFLPLSMESPYLEEFLMSCSNEAWFRTIAVVLRAANLDDKIFEKISIILQKLSKIRTNKKLFDVYSITSLIQELSRSAATAANVQQEQPFLELNLRSILSNLNSFGPSIATAT